MAKARETEVLATIAEVVVQLKLSVAASRIFRTAIHPNQVKGDQMRLQITIAWTILLAIIAALCIMLFMAESAWGEPRILDWRATDPVVIAGPLTYQSVPVTQIELLAKFVQDQDIYVIISSPGGFIDPSLKIVALMEAQAALGKRIHCLVNEDAASMAFQIFVACTHRYAYPSATLMFHGAWSAGRLNEEGLADQLAQIRIYNLHMDIRVIKALGISMSDYKKCRAAEINWTAEVLSSQFPGFVTIVDAALIPDKVGRPAK